MSRVSGHRKTRCTSPEAPLGGDAHLNREGEAERVFGPPGAEEGADPSAPPPESPNAEEMRALAQPTAYRRCVSESPSLMRSAFVAADQLVAAAGAADDAGIVPAAAAEVDGDMPDEAPAMDEAPATLDEEARVGKRRRFGPGSFSSRSVGGVRRSVN